MIYRLLILIILIILNGIFSASELAFLSLNKIKLKEEVEKGDKKAISIDNILKEPSSFLSTIQIAITLAGFLASAFAAEYFANHIIERFSINTANLSIIKPVLVIIVTLLLSYFSLVFGELVPKRVAINNPYQIARNYVGLIKITRMLFYPFIKILTKSTELICNMLGIKENNDYLTEEDIKKMILLGREEGIIEEKEKEYILNIFKFKDIPVSQVMTPKKDVVMINIDDNIKSIISKVKKEKYSRFPVYKDNENNVIGTLNIKDLIIKRSESKRIDLYDLVRPTQRFKHNQKIDDVFRMMQEHNESICPIYKKDEFIGLVTIEDAVEEIVGNIYDEYD